MYFIFYIGEKITRLNLKRNMLLLTRLKFFKNNLEIKKKLLSAKKKLDLIFIKFINFYHK